MPSRDAGRASVAVVEDDREMRELLREALDNQGYAVTAVGTGAAANEAVRGGDVDGSSSTSGCPTRTGSSSVAAGAGQAFASRSWS